MTQAAPKVFQMNQNVLLVKLMPITLTDIVHKLSFMKKKPHLFLQFIVTDNSDLHRGCEQVHHVKDSCSLSFVLFCIPFFCLLKLILVIFLHLLEETQAIRTSEKVMHALCSGSGLKSFGY